MSLSRKKWILLLLFAGGRRRKYNEPVAGRTRLMKELFLLGQRVPELEDYFEFEPYRFGPHSKEVLQVLAWQISKGLVQATPGYGSEVYSLTPRGVEEARDLFAKLRDDVRRKLVDIKIQFNSISLPELLDYVYDHYPLYASVSEYRPDAE